MMHIMTGDKSALQQKIYKFFSQYPTQHFRKGDILIFSGDKLQHVFYIEKGAVQQYGISSDGSRITVNIFKPQAFFPMSYALNGGYNAYFFEATQYVAVRVCPQADAVTFLRDNPDITLDLLARVYRGTDGILRRVMLVSGASARERILLELVTEYRRFGSIQHDSHTISVISQREIAERCGLARETVNRHMRILQQECMIAHTQGGMTVDVDRIEQELQRFL